MVLLQHLDGRANVAGDDVMVDALLKTVGVPEGVDRPPVAVSVVLDNSFIAQIQQVNVGRGKGAAI